MEIIINTYTHTITKNTPNEYSFLIPDVDLLTLPTINFYKLGMNGNLVLDKTQEVISFEEYTFELTDGIYIVEFLNYNNVIINEGEVNEETIVTRYYTLLTANMSMLKCLLDITTNLICTDLCNNCYPDWAKDSVILLSADYYMQLMNNYYGIVYERVIEILDVTELPLSADVLEMLKLQYRLSLYCDDCINLKADCGC